MPHYVITKLEDLLPVGLLHCPKMHTIMTTSSWFISVLIGTIAFHTSPSYGILRDINVTEIGLNCTNLNISGKNNFVLSPSKQPIPERTFVEILAPSFYELDPSQSERFLAVDVTESVCSSTKLCNTNRTKSPLCAFECTQCQCDEICHYYGDCCPDLLFQHSPHAPLVPFPHLTCVYGSWTTWANDSHVFMVSRCPVKHFYADKDAVRKCTFPDINYRDQATPVSVIDSHITYRNIYCAMCHDVTDTKPWTHQVKCRPWVNIQKATTREDLWRMVLKFSCDVTSLPPPGVLTRPCYPVSIGRCNVTGKWWKRIPVVERLCDLYTHGVDYYGSSPSFVSYRNVFCALCNGVAQDIPWSCVRIDSPHIPLPLSILLDFNSETERTRQKENDNKCESGQIFDPFSRLCRSLQCSERRILEGDDCEYLLSSTKGLGFRWSLIVRPNNATLNLREQDFITEYVKELINILQPFKPTIFKSLKLLMFDENVYENLPVHEPEITKIHHNNYEVTMISVMAEVVTMSGRSIKDMEETLKEILHLPLTYSDGDNNTVTLLSTPVPCSWSDDWTNDHYLISVHLWDNSLLLHKDFKDLTSSSPRVEQILDCAFVEYNLTLANFTYNSEFATVEHDNHTIHLNESRHLFCGETLKICSDVVAFIQNVLMEKFVQSRTTIFYRGTGDNMTMAIVSLVCISLSLVGLFVTFLIYCFVPLLRTVPGKNTMALICYLFFAQLTFLIGTSWRDTAILCRVIGVLIHYLWLASFAWMAISAHHMQKVFTSLVIARDAWSQSKQIVRYFLIGNLSPLVVVLSCMIYHLSKSEGSDIGYGGDICFLKGSNILLIFFIAPLGLMLLYNMFCFVRTIMAIRNVPDMKEASNKSNRQHVLVYIKLSLLFGFTWLIGIIAAIFQSDVLWYVFMVLTGNQGLLIFIAYCVNRRTWKLLKAEWRLKRQGTKDILSIGDASAPSSSTRVPVN